MICRLGEGEDCPIAGGSSFPHEGRGTLKDLCVVYVSVHCKVQRWMCNGDVALCRITAWKLVAAAVLLL